MFVVPAHCLACRRGLSTLDVPSGPPLGALQATRRGISSTATEESVPLGTPIQCQPSAAPITRQGPTSHGESQFFLIRVGQLRYLAICSTDTGQCGSLASRRA